VFAPDGGSILTASSDHTARLWEAFSDFQALVDRVKAEVPRLRAFKKAITAVEEFLESEEGAKWRKQQDDDVLIDPDDLEFWEYHLEI